MKKVVAFSTVLVLVVFLAVAVASAEGNSPVQYSFTLTDLEQGAGGGGPLFADGSAGGHIVVSARDGQVIGRFNPVSWSEIVPGESIDLCIAVDQIKGPPGFFPTYFCTSWVGIAIPISGTPVVITNPMGGSDLLLRVTPAGWAPR
jgi:hypothetical protein